jgi:hypothetical protein
MGKPSSDKTVELKAEATDSVCQNQNLILLVVMIIAPEEFAVQT